MTNFKMVAPAGRIIKKLGVKELALHLKDVDLESKEAQETLGKELFCIIGDHLDEIADDMIELCAAYKNVSIDEMKCASPFKELKDLFADEEFAGFFKSVLARNQQKN